MSTNKEKQEEKPDLQAVLQAMGAEFTKAMEEQAKNFESLVSKQIDGAMNEVRGKLNEHATAINSIIAKINETNAPQQQQPQGRVSGAITELMNSPLGQELAPIVKEKLGLTVGPDPAVEEFRRNSEMLNKIIYKKAAQITGKMIEKAMKGVIKDDFVSTEASELAKSAIAHEPV